MGDISKGWPTHSSPPKKYTKNISFGLTACSRWALCLGPPSGTWRASPRRWGWTGACRQSSGASAQRCVPAGWFSSYCTKETVWWCYSDKKENKIFLIYKEIQSGAVAKSDMRKGFTTYEEMRKYFPYEEVVSHIWFCNWSILNFLIYEANLIFFFIRVLNDGSGNTCVTKRCITLMRIRKQEAHG